MNNFCKFAVLIWTYFCNFIKLWSYFKFVEIIFFSFHFASCKGDQNFSKNSKESLYFDWKSRTTGATNWSRYLLKFLFDIYYFLFTIIIYKCDVSIYPIYLVDLVTLNDPCRFENIFRICTCTLFKSVEINTTAN